MFSGRREKGEADLYLKQVDILGFKSFADKVRLELGPGITAIVGPNGSGKSNIADAIRWALGEQNPRELRGSRMEDVIFSGTEQRQPLGIAEVSLTLDNSDNALPIDYAEVLITRRVDRSGTGEYLINRTPCRLKDVATLVGGSGMGRPAYSFVGQGRIDEILSDRAEERRPAFEEAAGVLRHKQTKAEAVRLSDQVAAKVARLGDIAGELARHLEPLREEALRASRRRELSLELGRLELSLLAGELREARHRQEELAAANTRLATELSTLEERLTLGQVARDACRERLEAVEQELDRAGKAAMAAAQKHERAESAARLHDEALARVRERLKEVSAEMEAFSARRSSLRDGEGDDSPSRLAAGISTVGGEIARLEDRLRAIRESRSGLAAALGVAREELLRAQSEAIEARTLAEEAGRERARLQEEALALRGDRDRLSREMERVEAESRRREDDLGLMVKEGRRLAAERAAAVALLEERGRELEALRARVHGLRARADLLREMMETNEGLARGPRAVLGERDRGVASFRGILGPVAQLVRVPERYERAVEVALGPAAQYIVVETEADAQFAVEWLRADRAGRATFLPIDTLRPSPVPQRDQALGKRTGAIGWASDLVEYEDRLRPVVRYLLGRVLLAPDLAAARALARAAGYKYRIVTLDGELIHPGGAITGGGYGDRDGDRDGRRERGLLSRVQERERLAALLPELETALAQSERAAGEAGEGLATADGSLRQLAEDEGRRRHELEGLRSEGGRLRRELLTVEDRLRLVTERLSGLETDPGRGEDRSAGGAIEPLSERVSGLEREIAALDEEKEVLHLSRLAAERDMRREELDRALAGRRQLWEQLRREQESLEAMKGQALMEAASLASGSGEARNGLERFQAERRELFASWKGEEEALARYRRRQAEVGDDLRSGQVAEARAQMRVDSLLERFAQEHGLGEKEALAQPAPTDLAATRERSGRIRSQLNALGPVNPRAPADYAAQEARLDQMRAGLADLGSARARLVALAGEIDRRLADLFQQTFREVRREFQALFGRLFGGGKADIFLADEREPLSAGVEIVAQPPGKKLQHLSLLSGGERALTAIALLFALLRVRPAPFCVLDEIDAALDDTNVSRFAGFLREMVGPRRGAGMQFIVVTHKKGTMEVADQLHGVTMGGGLSRIVSLKFPEKRRVRRPDGEEVAG